MHAPRNLPILLTTLADGRVAAECVLLPSCRVTATSREEAMRAIERLVRALLDGGGAPPAVDYEVVHLAVGGVALAG